MSGYGLVFVLFCPFLLSFLLQIYLCVFFLSISVSYQFLLFTSVSFVLFLHLVLNIICHSKKSFSIFFSFKPILLSLTFTNIAVSNLPLSLGFNRFSNKVFASVCFSHPQEEYEFVCFAFLFRVRSQRAFYPRFTPFFVCFFCIEIQSSFASLC